MNLTPNSKYNVKPGKVQKKTIENNSLADIYNQYRLRKVKDNYARTERYVYMYAVLRRSLPQ